MARTRAAKKRAADSVAADAPAVILVEPQLGENIGMVARAMLNFSLSDLRLVRPRDRWPNPKAVNVASGADVVLDGARLFDTTEQAVADLHHIAAATARLRDMTKTVMTPNAAAAAMVGAGAGRWGILFGPENAGLDNDDLALAEVAVHVEANPAFMSLNLAQAVLVMGYEWYQAAAGAPAPKPARKYAEPARQEEIVRFYEHLESELDACGFLRIGERRPRMVRNIRNIFNRIPLTDQEVRTLRGIVTCLAEKQKRPR
jgi:tRNA/rRNA methyltransferase